MSTPDMKHFRSRDSHFELDVPRGWNSSPPVPTNSPSELIRFAPEGGSHLLIIFRDPHNPHQSLQEVSHRVQQVLAKNKCGNFTSSETSIGSRTAPTLDFDKLQGDAVWSCRYYFVAGETLRYVLGFGTIKKADMWQLFDRVAKTFAILAK